MYSNLQICHDLGLIEASDVEVGRNTLEMYLKRKTKLDTKKVKEEEVELQEKTHSEDRNSSALTTLCHTYCRSAFLHTDYVQICSSGRNDLLEYHPGHYKRQSSLPAYVDTMKVRLDSGISAASDG